VPMSRCCCVARDRLSSIHAPVDLPFLPSALRGGSAGQFYTSPTTFWRACLTNISPRTAWNVRCLATSFHRRPSPHRSYCYPRKWNGQQLRTRSIRLDGNTQFFRRPVSSTCHGVSGCQTELPGCLGSRYLGQCRLPCAMIKQ